MGKKQKSELKSKRYNTIIRKPWNCLNHKVFLLLILVIVMPMCKKNVNANLTEKKDIVKSYKDFPDIKDLIISANVDYGVDYLFSVNKINKNKKLESTSITKIKDGSQMLENIYRLNNNIKFIIGNESRMTDIFSIEILDSGKCFLN